MWFKLKATDVGFAESANKHFTYDFRVPGPPGPAFDALTDPVIFARWFPDLRDVRWVTAEPHGVGSVREVKLRGISVRERILVWEPGRRFSFTITRASAPLLTRMVEDYRLSATGDGETRIQWTIAYQPRAILNPLERVLKPAFSKLFQRACGRLQEHLMPR